MSRTVLRPNAVLSNGTFNFNSISANTVDVTSNLTFDQNSAKKIYQIGELYSSTDYVTTSATDVNLSDPLVITPTSSTSYLWVSSVFYKVTVGDGDGEARSTIGLDYYDGSAFIGFFGATIGVVSGTSMAKNFYGSFPLTRVFTATRRRSDTGDWDIRLRAFVSYGGTLTMGTSQFSYIEYEPQ